MHLPVTRQIVSKVSALADKISKLSKGNIYIYIFASQREILTLISKFSYLFSSLQVLKKVAALFLKSEEVFFFFFSKNQKRKTILTSRVIEVRQSRDFNIRNQT